MSLGALLAAGGAGWLYFGGPRLDTSRVYRIGSDNAFPYHAVDAKGEASGFSVEILNEAARRRGIRLQWVASKVRAVEALRRGEVDLWPALSDEVLRIEPSLHLSKAWINNDFGFVALRDQFRDLANAAKVRRVAFREQPNARRLAAERFPGADLLPAPDRESAVGMVCSGQADGAVIELRSAYLYMAVRPEACHNQPPCFVGLTFRGEQLRIASRAESAPVADSLRDEIDAMSGDGTTERLMLPWSYFQSNEVESMYSETKLASSLRAMTILFAVSVLLLAGVATEYLLLRKAWKARDQANEENWAKSRFLQKMNHELRTPLNGIVVGAELLQSTSLEKTQSEYVGIIRSSGESMLRLIEDLLDLSKAVREGAEARSFSFRLQPWLDSTTVPYAHQARCKGLSFRVYMAPSLYPGLVNGDSIRLGQILANLLSNALKFTDNGEIRVDAESVRRDGKLLLTLTVSDTGCGIASERLPHVFEAAVYRDRIDDPHGGLGLGLSITAELVRTVGGSIEAESKLGIGSTFRVRVPLELTNNGNGIHPRDEVRLKS